MVFHGWSFACPVQKPPTLQVTRVRGLLRFVQWQNALSRPVLLDETLLIVRWSLLASDLSLTYPSVSLSLGPVTAASTTPPPKSKPSLRRQALGRMVRGVLAREVATVRR